jgi:2'-hydroxyisoflavone reductase
MSTNRRGFLQTAALTAAALGLGRGALAAQGARRPPVPASANRLRLLILGGTAFLGPAVVEEALRRGHTMTLFNRGKTNPGLFPALEKLEGDREKEGDIQVLEGRRWDAVIDTSAYVPSHVEAAASLVAETAKQYVVLSTVGVYADHSVPADESSPVAKVTDEFLASVKTIKESLANYGGMKALCEKAAETVMPGRVTAIRPGLIVGPRDRSDRFTYWAVRVARGGELLAPGDGADPVQWVDVRDLANFVLDCIEQELTGTFNAISPAGRYDMEELLHGLKGSFWTDARFTWVPADFLEKHEVQGWTHLPVWVPREGEYAAFHLVNTDKAVAAGLRFRPLAETARDTLAWFNSTRPADYEFGKRAGISREREAEVLAAWHSRDAESDAPGAAAGSG